MIRFITPLRAGSRTRFWSACLESPASPALRLGQPISTLLSRVPFAGGSIQAVDSRRFEYEANEFYRRIGAMFLIAARFIRQSHKIACPVLFQSARKDSSPWS